MKKLALALMASAAAVFGFGMVANAYPPAAGVAVISNTNPAAGAAFTIVVGCTPPTPVTFVFPSPGGETKTVPCVATAPAALVAAPAAGKATVTFNAPTAGGTYTGTYTGGATGSFTITVAAVTNPGGGLPATGSDGIGSMTLIAIGLFGAGAGLFAVSQVRRRQTASA